ncbi:hypothetical protein HDU76_009904, partial [Blyttiomyces sp. JEL0837]
MGSLQTPRTLTPYAYAISKFETQHQLSEYGTGVAVQESYPMGDLPREVSWLQVVVLVVQQPPSAEAHSGA